MRKFPLLLLSCLVFVLGIAASAEAAIVTVGSSLAGTSPAGIGSGNTLFNFKGPANTVSPVTGAVVGWNVVGASAGPYHLRVVAPVGTNEFTGVAKSAPFTPLNTGVQHFDTLLPIKAGQIIAFDHANPTDTIGVLSVPATIEWGFFPGMPLGEGTPAKPNISPGLELGFNAEVQPAPAILAIGTTSGPVGGGTSVLITGSDLAGTIAVKFGAASAAFGQVSETAVLATSPSTTSAGGVPISVTTRAGTGTSSQLFTYQAPAAAATVAAAPVSPPPPTTLAPVKCKVPNLAGKRLKGAKKAIRAQHCKVGLVTKEEGVTAKTGTVVKQNPKAGLTKAADSPVNIKLG
jgi:hypothetical protein